MILVANKAEGKAGESGILESFALGLGDPVPFSAEHGEGLADLFGALAPHIDRDATDPTLEPGHEESAHCPAPHLPLTSADHCPSRWLSGTDTEQ